MQWQEIVGVCSYLILCSCFYVAMLFGLLTAQLTVWLLVCVCVCVLLQEFALKGSIEKFNSCYYQPDALPPPSTSMATANGLMGGVGGVVTGENQATAATQNSTEEEEVTPLDQNYLSALGKEVCVCVCVSNGYEL